MPLGECVMPDDISRGAISDFVDQALRGKPELMVHSGDLPATARALRDLFSAAGNLFDRGMMPVRVVRQADGGPPAAIRLTINSVVTAAHRLCQPVKLTEKHEWIATTLPDRVARMYLDMAGEWELPPLDGISAAPLLSDDGAVRGAEGYDPKTQLWCCKVPALRIPECPSRSDAESALRCLRQAFCTFPFADAARHRDPALGIEVVDTDEPPANDESAFLTALLTAVCRASLWLAPGFLITAPAVSGAGTGKGLLVRAICAIAFGIRPRAFTAGNDRVELDKRIAAELIEATPTLMLDNVNGATLRSDTLASVLTERPARVRVLGETRMVALNTAAFVAVTGNGLTISEDLARRFITCEFDAQCEDPESRPFASGFLEIVEKQRAELLAAALTIWRYGRMWELRRGRPLGSFERWCEWVRDPLLALGCADPVERIDVAKAQDPRRQGLAELFGTWWDCHRGHAVKAANLADEVVELIDPQKRGRQFVASCLGRLAGTRAAGFVLTRQLPAGTWGAATYSLRRTTADAGNEIGHRERTGHRDRAGPMTPMPPMPDGTEDDDESQRAAQKGGRRSGFVYRPLTREKLMRRLSRRPDPAEC
jgi:hypothetical protein